MINKRNKEASGISIKLIELNLNCFTYIINHLVTS